jgi:tetratricopeptide (TPR) repeat protein
MAPEESEYPDNLRTVPAKRRARAAVALVALAFALAGLWVAVRVGRLSPRDPVAVLERAVERSPDDVRTRERLGLALLRAGRELDARPHLERALELGADSAEARIGLAAAYEELGHYPEAIEHARAALRQAPEDPAAALALARILATCPDPELRDPEQALRLADRVRASAEGLGAELLQALAHVYAAAGRPEAALRAAEAARDPTRHPTLPSGEEP